MDSLVGDLWEDEVVWGGFFFILDQLTVQSMGGKSPKMNLPT